LRLDRTSEDQHARDEAVRRLRRDLAVERIERALREPADAFTEPRFGILESASVGMFPPTPGRCN